MLDKLLTNASSCFGGKMFLRDARGEISFAQFYERVMELADRLGEATSERIGVVTNNSIECVVSVFAIYSAGGVFVPINNRCSPVQRDFILDDCGISRVISPVTSALFDSAWSSESISVHGREMIVQTSPNAELLQNAQLPPAELVALFYTSGSTGHQKGVMLSERNICLGGESVAEYLALDLRDTLLGVLPISFDAGFSQLTAALSSGSSVFLMNYLLPNDVPRAVEAADVTTIIGVPPLFSRMLQASWSEASRLRVRKFASTGGDMAPALLKKLRACFSRADPFVMYGLTEAFRATYLPPHDIDRKPGSVGKAIPHAEVFVVREDGSLCEPDEVGEIIQCGPLVSLGYWRTVLNNTGSYADFRRAPAYSRYGGQCVYSGDLGRVDSEGFLYFVGRRDGMIKIDGQRLSPIQLESIVLLHPQIQECTIQVSLLDCDDQVSLVALIVADPARGDLLGELASLLSANGIKRSFHPKRVVCVDKIPRDLNGKVDRVGCKKLVEER